MARPGSLQLATRHGPRAALLRAAPCRKASVRASCSSVSNFNEHVGCSERRFAHDVRENVRLLPGRRRA